MREADIVYERLQQVSRGVKHKFDLRLPDKTTTLAVFLWDTVEDYKREVGAPEGQVAGFMAAMTGSRGTNPTLHKSIGTLHFVSQNWNINVLGHEFFHVLMHIMRLQKQFKSIFDEDMAVEEAFALFFGQGLDRLFDELWSHDVLVSTDVSESESVQ